jgi:hypothetical protein
MRNLFRRTGPRPQLPLPHLIIAQRVIDKIIGNALYYATETGESLVGLVIHPPESQETDLCVLDTIAPDDSAVRSGVYFEQGDDLQADIFNWLYDGWELMRKTKQGSLEARWNVPLMHLGDWHKHPGTLVTPSMGDESTARSQISDRSLGTPHLLVVLATVWNEYEALQEEKSDQDDLAELSDMIEVSGMNNLAVQPEAEEEDIVVEEDQGTPLKYPIDDRTTVRIDCWYMSRQMRRFARLSPTVAPDADLPSLPKVSWHLTQPDRMRAEVERLSREGYAVSVEQFDTDQRAPLEVCFSLARRDSQHVLILVTQADYPNVRPTVRLTPMSAMKDLPERGHIFEQLWKESKALPQQDYPAWAWTPEHTLRDLALAVEARLTEGNKL